MTVFEVHFAGELFDHKHLCGNALLAERIGVSSQGKYLCRLPQDVETPAQSAEEIRNINLQQVMRCDLALFGFDGADIDSGTAAEFMLAKFLDIPAVILRSDFRAAGDASRGEEDWNLMCSFYPRTEVVRVNALEMYAQSRDSSRQNLERVLGYLDRIAERVVAALDCVMKVPQIPSPRALPKDALYSWVASAARLPTMDDATIGHLLADKARKAPL